LDVYRRYLGAYTTIIARARRVPFNNREVWIVDTHGGAGLHRSREDPDGFRYGSPLIACNAARLVQKKFPNFHVHVRAVEKQTPWVVRLQTRIEEFNRASPGSEVVDALVTNGNFADHVIDFIEQAQQANALSLWFIDPFGFKDIPYEALEPLTTPRFGPELIVNLDLSGIWRKAGKPDDIVDIGEVSTDQSDQQKALTRLFAERINWERALIAGGTRSRNLRSLAEAYCQLFRRFEYRRAHRLRSSDGQVRYLIHLAHSQRADQAFAAAFDASLKVELFAGRSMDSAARGQAAQVWFEMFKGGTTAVDQLYEESIGDFDRGQIATILREAELRGYGRFDESNRIMTWEEARQHQMSLGFDA
jgi:three-Cys-motif partner protein